MACLSLVRRDAPASTAFSMPSFPCDYPMQVMAWKEFRSLGYMPRSDDASSRGLLVEHSKSSPCIFVSHSWSDNLDFKWTAFERLAADFHLLHGRYPTFWLDKVRVLVCLCVLMSPGEEVLIAAVW